MTPEQIAKKLQTIANDVTAIMLEHEREDHDGERCEKERANVVAYLIHRLGLYWLKGMLLVVDRAKEYDEECQNGGAGHGH